MVAGFGGLLREAVLLPADKIICEIGTNPCIIHCTYQMIS